jgi:hypothetical protein
MAHPRPLPIAGHHRNWPAGDSLQHRRKLLDNLEACVEGVTVAVVADFSNGGIIP